ncbi:MAG: hypothetical protein IJ776_09600 [Paludibacteraceae bacterium]|nr:hypothetical protein [Paludibacteraceae bacterium]
MTQVDFHAGMGIDDAFRSLHEEAIRTGDVTSGSFNDHTITSQMTLDKCYQIITGKSKAEFDEDLRKRAEEYKRQEKEHQERVPATVEEYKEKAKGFIKESEWDYFVKILPIRCSDLYHGMEIQSMLDIIRVLMYNKEDTATALEQAEKVFYEQGHSGMSGNLVLNLVKRFSPVLGDEFKKKMY